MLNLAGAGSRLGAVRRVCSGEALPLPGCEDAVFFDGPAKYERRSVF